MGMINLFALACVRFIFPAQENIPKNRKLGFRQEPLPEAFQNLHSDILSFGAAKETTIIVPPSDKNGIPSKALKNFMLLAAKSTVDLLTGTNNHTSPLIGIPGIEQLEQGLSPERTDSILNLFKIAALLATNAGHDPVGLMEAATQDSILDNTSQPQPTSMALPEPKQTLKIEGRKSDSQPIAIEKTALDRSTTPELTKPLKLKTKFQHSPSGRNPLNGSSTFQSRPIEDPSP